MKEFAALNKKFVDTKRGAKMFTEIGDVFKVLDKSIYHNKNGLMINNDELVNIDDEINDVEVEFKSFKTSKWNKMY